MLCAKIRRLELLTAQVIAQLNDINSHKNDTQYKKESLHQKITRRNHLLQKLRQKKAELRNSVPFAEYVALNNTLDNTSPLNTYLRNPQASEIPIRPKRRKKRRKNVTFKVGDTTGLLTNFT